MATRSYLTLLISPSGDRARVFPCSALVSVIPLGHFTRFVLLRPVSFAGRILQFILLVLGTCLFHPPGTERGTPLLCPSGRNLVLVILLGCLLTADPDVEVTFCVLPGTVRWLPVPLQVPILVLRRLLCLSRYRERALCASPGANPDVEVTCYASPGTVRWLPMPLQVPLLVLRCLFMLLQVPGVAHCASPGADPGVEALVQASLGKVSGSSFLSRCRSWC